jgi:hypothetical protein
MRIHGFFSTILAVRHILTGMDTCKAVTCGTEAGRRNCCTMDDGGREKGTGRAGCLWIGTVIHDGGLFCLIPVP